MVCNLVKGTRIAHAIGREIGEKDESDLAKKVNLKPLSHFIFHPFLSENLKLNSYCKDKRRLGNI